MANFYTVLIQFQYQNSTGLENLTRCFTIQDIPTVTAHSDEDCFWEEILMDTVQSIFKGQEIQQFISKECQRPSEKNQTILRRLNNATTIEEVIKARFSGVCNLKLTILEHILDTSKDNPEITTEVLLEDTPV